jgi:lactate dehydrogenase-like 2-hydroxyacid dehydrogenase
LAASATTATLTWDIVVTNTPDVLTKEVADFPIGLLIATTRQLVAADAFVRSGAWAQGAGFPLSPSRRDRKIGLVRMGRIGEAIGRRCVAMGLKVTYHSRRRRADLDLAYCPDLVNLASDSEVLIVLVPGGPATHGLIDGTIPNALGANGILINVARGTVVDEQALISDHEGASDTGGRARRFP